MRRVKVEPQPENLGAGRYKLQPREGSGFVGDAIYFKYDRSPTLSDLFKYATPEGMPTRGIIRIGGTFYWAYENKNYDDMMEMKSGV